ncbi:BnaC09g32200D [Brassica napus]|uniref:(rape) hypothetical protein n=1 Tax=Brassica napus TaxID=3708 RepID=A0A078GQ37_BRANA|nr:unnamed protein product [Brassica napus]CDY28655.1 BnaC09g32200D [Brassica napus]
MKVDDNTMDVTTFRFALLYFVLNRDFPTSQHSIRLLLFPELLSRASGRCSNVAEVRLLRYWEARHVRKGGELMSVDMLFVNENDLLVQTVSLGSGNVSARALSTRTSLEKITASARPIPTELLRFMPYGQILELANTGKQLPDIIGELNAIRSTITDRIPGAQRVMLTLRLESYGREPKIIIATSVNPKIVGLARSADLGAFTSKVVRAQKIEPMTTSELNQFIITADSQSFFAPLSLLVSSKMTVGVILAAPGVPRNLSERYLPSHVFHVMKLMLYRITLSVSDYTDTASFLAFDMEMAKLTNVQASEAAQIVGIGVDAQHQTFTISRIFPERVLVPMPAFVEVANVPADAQAEDVAQGTNANVGITSTGADKPTISDASTGKRPPPAKDQDDVDKTAPKKAHVE